MLETKNLSTFFPVKTGVFHKVTAYIKAVNDVTVRVEERQVVSIVGESGCGKSTLGLSVLGLVPVTSGEIYLTNNFIDVKVPGAWNPYRKDFQIIFQDPFTSLNPRHTIFRILSEPLLVHNIHTKKTVRAAVAGLLEQVGLSPDYMQRFPHAFSGGQRQRVAIARAIGILPRLIVCDEVVSALDVSVQAQIIELLLGLKKKMGLALMFIAHDLSLVKAISDRVYVMYLGKILESEPTSDLFKHPQHPYTEALLNSIPTTDRNKRPKILKGEVPSPVNLPIGCIFRSRCPYAQKRCAEKHPDLLPRHDGLVACYFPL
jgi:peptide/nickel transport system ATP-binding protein/oligopeptide transport system ATP-binding protein